MTEKEEVLMSWKIILFPIATVCIVLIPLFEAALQIELSGSLNIPLHWRLFLAAAIGAGLGVAVQVLKKITGIEAAKKDIEIKDLKQSLEVLTLEQQLTEREIMINSLLLVKNWNVQNQEIKTLKDLEKALKPPEETI